MRQSSVLGIMVTRGSRWVLRSYLWRHAAMFELLAVLDGSKPGSADAQWAAQQCARYPNVRYATEREANLTGPATDQTTRAAATRLLLQSLGTTRGPADTSVLEGHWIFLAHPDEFFVQDVRVLVAIVAARDPLATVVLFDILYAMPTPEERSDIVAQHGNNTPGADSFEPIERLAHCDAAFRFREPRLFRWTAGTRWGVRHGLTTPQVHPGHRQWPVAREVALGHSPFYVHFKVHDFDDGAFTLRSDGARGAAWVAFRSSGFATGLAPHRAHGKLQLSGSDDAAAQVFGYYARAGRAASPLRGELRKRCTAPGVLPRCSLPWRAAARFSARARRD